MTQAEAKAKSAEKVKQITDLAEKLQIVFTAKEVIIGNEIKKVVYFTDCEEYDVEKTPIVTRSPQSPNGGSMPTHISEVQKDENSDIHN